MGVKSTSMGRLTKAVHNAIKHTEAMLKDEAVSSLKLDDIVLADVGDLNVSTKDLTAYEQIASYLTENTTTSGTYELDYDFGTLTLDSISSAEQNNIYCEVEMKVGTADYIYKWRLMVDGVERIKFSNPSTTYTLYSGNFNIAKGGDVSVKSEHYTTDVGYVQNRVIKEKRVRNIFSVV